jgi:2-keto-4-pentenoate hydratase/2-oxohepta-3-ene-1,7-dioic acid hydratase in catechol pathway
MKLLRYGPPGAERPGLLDDRGRIHELGAEIGDLDPETIAPHALERLRQIDRDDLPVVRGTPRIGVPVSGIGKIVAVGLNYADHAKEAGMPIPEEPVLFTKATSAISGPFDPVVIPEGSAKTDWEVELAFVIGQTARYVAEQDAISYIAGYCILNDVSERAFQLERGGQWVKGKSADTFAPIGPWLVTPDEVPDPQNLGMQLEVNNKRYQDGNTNTMIFGVATLVSYISRYMTLLPGDIVTTGTPPGVGQGQTPPLFLKPGDVMVLRIEGLGEQRQELIAV